MNGCVNFIAVRRNEIVCTLKARALKSLNKVGKQIDERFQKKLTYEMTVAALVGKLNLGSSSGSSQGGRQGAAGGLFDDPKEKRARLEYMKAPGSYSGL